MCQKVSIIIPVYNAEKYITPCIESLLKQTLQECEFIFINDGSKDNSRRIIEEYQRLDPRIKLINQENQGVSIARNTGLHLAAGEYVGFVDADDYIENDMYETLFNAAKLSDCDVVISNFESELEGHKVITKYPFPIDTVLNRDYIKRELLLYFLRAENLNSVWNKIYKTEVIREHDVTFPEGVELGEDQMFNLRFFSIAASMIYVDFTGYHYNETMGSATRNIVGKDYFKRALEVYKLELPEIFTNKINKEEISQLKSIRLIKSVMSYTYIYLTTSKEVSFSKRYKYVKNMISNRYVRESLPAYYNEHYNNLGRYERWIMDMIRGKLILGLYCATVYSRLRNKKSGGINS